MGSAPFNVFAKPRFFTATPDLSEKLESSDISITGDTLINLQLFTEADM